MLLHVACYYYLLSQIGPTQYQISVRATQTEPWKKGVPVGRKMVFRICAFETNYN